MTTDFRKAVGTKGLSVWAGIITEEYLSILRNWDRAAKIYREMIDSDVIGTLLEAIKMPLLAADFDVVPAADEEVDRQAAEFVWDAMNSMVNQTWRSHVSDMLEALDFGFALSEITIEKREDGRLWLRNLDPRGQETLHQWEFEGDELIGFSQRHPVSGAILEIPIAKLIHVTFRGRKGNPQGKSLLRSLYRPWRFMANFENLEGIGVERDVGGTPMVEWDADQWGGFTQDQLKEIYEDSLKGLRMDEEVYLINVPGAKVVPYGGGSKLYNVREVIKDKRKQILQRFFAQFIELGMDQVGTQALVQGSQDFFALGLRSVQQELLESWNQRLVPTLLQFNTFPGIAGPPQITWNDAGTIDVEGILKSYDVGVKSKVITPVREDEEHIRAIMDLPDLPDDVGNEPREVVQIPLPGMGGFNASP